MTAKARDFVIKPWTEAEDARLRYMWSEGSSASEIGADLKRSRSAVLGRKKRLKIDDRPIKVIRERAAVEARHARVRRMQRNKPPKPRVLHIEKAPEPVADVSALRGRPWEALEGSNPIRLQQLETRLCKWPIGLDSPFMFCGAETPIDRSYCPVHAAIAYKPVPVKL